MYNIVTGIKKEYTKCHICPKNCSVNRLNDESGFCGIGRNSKVFNTTVLVKECEEIAPTYAIYFAGCSLNCVFCSVSAENALVKLGKPQLPNPQNIEKEKTQVIIKKNYTDSQTWNNTGLAQNHKIKMGRVFIDIDDEFVKRVKKEIEEAKPKTISFIGGEPSVHLLTIFELVEKLNPRIPLIFYTNLYYNSRINRILSEWFKYIVADIHFGSDRCARMLTESNPRLNIDYWRTVTKNAVLLKDVLIVRHLLLPGHIDCCFKKIIDWMNAEIPNKPLNLLTNYFPYMNTQISADEHRLKNTNNHRLKNTGLLRRVSTDEIAEALDYAKNKGIIIKVLDLLKLRSDMNEATAHNQEIVIDEEGTVVFKYMDGMAVEMARFLSSTG